MDPRPLLSFKSHIDGKNADVTIYADRLEWERSGGMSMTRLATGAATLGASLAATGMRKGGGTEMIPVKVMTSVTTQKDGLRFYKVVVTVPGNVLGFRCDKGEASAAKDLLTQLIVGSHPAQQAAPAPAPAPLAAPAAVAPAAMQAPAASPNGLADELVKLAGLRDAGILTGDEFAAQKARLLG